MRVHHLNCATMCPLGAKLINGRGGLLEPATLVCHCLLVESEDGLILVDTGLGTKDLADPGGRLGAVFKAVTRPRCDPQETALARVQALGFKREDVRHIVVTHLDLDHAGGLGDFPDAKVHVWAAERAAALAPPSFRESERYRKVHWAHGPKWEVHGVAGERWFGFEAVRALQGVGPELLLVPLPGHTRGHCAVAVRTSESWLVHCGDAYFYRGEMDPQGPRCTPGLALFQRLVAIDDVARRHNQARLVALVKEHGSEVTLFSAHDPEELARFEVRA